MNASNQPSRQYSYNTCELSIKDKKSPFPEWMKFNKPHPLKFTLDLLDPDQPERAPLTLTGDRGKLESLHQSVDGYVQNLVAKAPLPQLTSQPDSGMFTESPTSSILESVERPIDALNMTGDSPRLEADGTSRHLLYLGNLAQDGQVMTSLSTLQLFDLSSALEEGLQLVPAVVASPEPGLEPTQAEPEAVANTNNVVSPSIAPATELDNTRVESKGKEVDLSEQRVFLPSVNETLDPEALESESSFYERHSTVDNRSNRFAMPKPSLGNLNLPDLPDFSNSPLSSIWLWSGLGTVAAGIVAFPFVAPLVSNYLGSSNNSSNPTAASSPTATDPTTAATVPSELQASSVPLPSGLSSSPSPSSSLNPSAASSPGATVSPGSTTPRFFNPNQYGSGAGVTNSSPFPTTAPSGNSAGAGANGVNPLRQSTPTRNNPSGQVAGKEKTTNAELSITPTPNRIQGRAAGSTAAMPNPSRLGIKRSSGNGGRQNSPLVENPTIAQGTRSNTPNTIDDFDQLTSRTPADASGATVPAPSARARITSRSRATTPNVGLTGQDSGDLFGANPRASENSTLTFPADNTPDLAAPARGLSSADTPQMQGTQQYFERRWKGDNNFNDSLQYVIRVNKNGRVAAIEGQNSVSKAYLQRTNFLKPGSQIANTGGAGQDQSIRVILRNDGSVETMAE